MLKSALLCTRMQFETTPKVCLSCHHHRWPRPLLVPASTARLADDVMPELLELLKLLELPKLLKLTGARVPAGAASARQGERAAGGVGGRRRSGGSRGRREHRRRVQPETLRRAARGKSGEVLNLLREPKAGQGSRGGRSESQWDERREAEELAVASPRADATSRSRPWKTTSSVRNANSVAWNRRSAPSTDRRGARAQRTRQRERGSSLERGGRRRTRPRHRRTERRPRAQPRK